MSNENNNKRPKDICSTSYAEPKKLKVDSATTSFLNDDEPVTKTLFSLPVEILQIILKQYISFDYKFRVLRKIPEFSNLLEDRASWLTEDYFLFYRRLQTFKPGLYVGSGSAFLVEIDNCSGEMCFKCIKKKFPESSYICELKRKVHFWRDPAQLEFKRTIAEVNNFLDKFLSRFKLFNRKTMRIYEYGNTDILKYLFEHKNKYFFVDFAESVVYWRDGTRYFLKNNKYCSLVDYFNLNPNRLPYDLKEMDRRREIDNFNENATCLEVNPDFSIRIYRGFSLDGEKTVFGKNVSIVEPIDVDAFVQVENLFESRMITTIHDDEFDDVVDYASLVSVKNTYLDRHVFWRFVWIEDDDLIELFRLPHRRKVKGHEELYKDLKRVTYPEGYHDNHSTEHLLPAIDRRAKSYNSREISQLS